MHGIRTINGQYPDDNRDFDINAGNGIRIEPATGGITIINDSAASSFVEGDNIEITPSGDDLVIRVVSDPHISGNLEVDGTTTLNDTLQVNADIIQNGAAYETHAEKVYTTNDYIITRDGAVSGLSAGDYSGFQVKKYDGTNDGRLVIDNSGVARVGDVGDEQPLLTRSESVSLTNGNLLQWNGTSQKAVDAGINTSQIVRGTGNIGDDTKPVKVVNGVATAVTNALQTELTVEDITSQVTIDSSITGSVKVIRYGKMVQITFDNVTIGSSPNETHIITNLPPAKATVAIEPNNWTTTSRSGILLAMFTNNNFLRKYTTNTVSNIYMCITYITS